MIGGSCICKHPPRAYYTSTYSIVLSRMVICSALNLPNLCCLLSTLPRRGHTTNQLPVNIPGTGAIKNHSNKQNKSCTALLRNWCSLTSRMLCCSQDYCNYMSTWILYHAMSSYSSQQLAISLFCVESLIVSSHLCALSYHFPPAHPDRAKQALPVSPDKVQAKSPTPPLHLHKGHQDSVD